MAGEDDNKSADGKPRQGDDRQARLEQALRANLLKRKEKARLGKDPSAAKGPRTPPEEGRQT